MKTRTVILAADHAGYRLKESLRRFLEGRGFEVLDFGTTSAADVDYPDFILPAAQAVATSGGAAVGIVIGGSGNGEQMAANKVPGIRAALCYDVPTARLARAHNDANVLALGARMPSGSFPSAKKIVQAFLSTPFSGAARHVRRLKKISHYEQR